MLYKFINLGSMPANPKLWALLLDGFLARMVLWFYYSGN